MAANEDTARRTPGNIPGCVLVPDAEFRDDLNVRREGGTILVDVALAEPQMRLGLLGLTAETAVDLSIRLVGNVMDARWEGRT